MLLMLAEDFDSVEDRIRLLLATGDGEREPDECRRLIRSYIDAHSDRNGFVSRWDAGDAVEGAHMVIDKALAVVEDGAWPYGLEMLLLVIEEMIELLQSADDSDGDIGAVIKRSLESIGGIVRERRRIPPEERAGMFRRLLEETRNPVYEGWSEWQIDLLEAANELIESDEMTREWEDAAESLLARNSDGEWFREFAERQIAMMRYRRLLERHGEERALEFAYEHLQFPDLREIAIRAALDRGKTSEAIRLLEDGEERDQRWPGHVFRWKKLRYEAYVRSGQIEPQRELAKELIAGGEVSYYHSVKATFADEGEWSAYLRDLLDALEQGSWRAQEAYEQILLEEGLYERLLKHVRKSPSRIESFHSVLMPHHPEEVKALFESRIKSLAQYAANRKEYAHVCRVIRMLAKAGGREEAQAITRKLMEQYARKPAFRDELGKIWR